MMIHNLPPRLMPGRDGTEPAAGIPRASIFSFAGVLHKLTQRFLVLLVSVGTHDEAYWLTAAAPVRYRGHLQDLRGVFSRRQAPGSDRARGAGDRDGGAEVAG